MSQWAQGARNRSLEDLVMDLQFRMARVERHLGLAPLEREPQAEEPEPAPALRPQPVETFEVPAGTRPVAAARPVVPPPLPGRPVELDDSLNVRVPVAGPAPVIPVYETPRPPAPLRQTELEQTIGLKWAGWVGAVVVVIGAALGIKYAYDQGWFQILPPAGRLALMSLGGVALLAAGEWVFRKVHRTAAACLYGAGVATLFLVSYAGHGYYRLYEPQTAFVLMGLTTAIGAAVAIRGNLLPIAVLAQIGGNLAPVLLHSDRPMLGSFLSYLLALQVVALALAWWGGNRKWWALRVMSLVTTSLWVLAVLSNPKLSADTGTLLAFSLVYAALYQAELLVSAARPRAADPEGGPVEQLSLRMPLTSATAVSAAFSLAVTALLTVAVLLTLHDASDAVRGAWVVVLAGACGAMGMLLSRGRDKTHPLHPLAVGFRVQAAALVVVAVPVALSGVNIVFGWVVLALAFAALGEVLDLPISRWAGGIVWRLALAYLVWWAGWPVVRDLGKVNPTGAHAVWLTLAGVALPAYLVMAWIVAATGHVLAWLGHRRDGERGTASVTAGLAAAAWFVASVAALPPAGATLAILVYCWLLIGADLVDPRKKLVLQAAVVLGLVTVKWVAVDTLAERLAPGWSPLTRRPVFNAVTGAGLLISMTLGAMYVLRRETLWSFLDSRRGSARRETEGPAAPLLTLAAAVMTLFGIGLTLEIDRIVEAAALNGTSLAWPLWQTKQMAWTILWSLALTAYVALARALEPVESLRPAWSKAAETMVALLAIKFLVIDTLTFRALAGSPPVTPVANFQSLTAATVVGALIVVTLFRGGARGKLPSLAGFLAVLVVLWSGTLEIDRFFERMRLTGGGFLANPRLAKQVAISIFWSVFAVGAVVAGFRFRTAGLRYFGLGLFAFTLLKVVLFDMSQVQTGYRVLSFLGLGLLLMGTSVLYGKLSPVLLRANEEADAGMIPAGDAPRTT
jgi:uncharacterized membrane protein